MHIEIIDAVMSMDEWFNDENICELRWLIINWVMNTILTVWAESDLVGMS